MKVDTLQTVFTVCVVVGNATLLAAYGATLWRLKEGTKYPLFIRLVELLLFACVTSILVAVGNFILVKGISDSVFWISLEGVSSFVYEASFGSAHWLFAFEYFGIAKIMPLALQGMQQSESEKKLYATIRLVMLVLNVVLAFANASLTWLAEFLTAESIKSADPTQYAQTIDTVVWC